MTSFLIVDGQDQTEDGEGLLVEHIARRRFRHVVRLPYVPVSARAWTVVWFTGHVTLYRKARRASLEVRRGSQFYRVAEGSKLPRAELLVLASCYTDDPRVEWCYDSARLAIVHDGPLAHDDALVFAARFMPAFVRNGLRRGRVQADAVRDAFDDARGCASAAYARWSLLERRV